MNTAPPKISATASPLWFAGIILMATALGLGAVVFFFNPDTNGFYPVCQFHKLTGLNCPGCGATRALYALLHGNFLAALRDNALFVLGVVLSALRAAWMVIQKISGKPTGEFFPPKLLWIVLTLLLVFGVVRNLPGCEWLSPA